MTEDAIRNLLKRSECGLVADIRVRYGKKVNGRTKDNIYAVVEYAHENSVPRSLKLASQKRAFVHGVNCRVFKSGTRTVVVKPQQKRANR